MKIAIIGTHGTGKTTLAYHIAAEAKSRGFNARLINECARDCPFPLNEKFDLKGAQWIVATQIQKELQAEASKANFIVCDRSAIDPVMYLKHSSTKDLNICNELYHHQSYECLYEFCNRWMITYDRIFFVIPTENKIVDDGVRSTDANFQKSIHELFFSYSDKISMNIVYDHQILNKDFEPIYKEIFG
jgi:nicotinamide riboside kinase